MGLFDKLAKYIPGGPVSIAKTMLRAFNHYKEKNPNSTRDEALRYAIESRYQIVNVMNKEEIESCLKRTKYLGDLVFCVIEKENPVALSEHYEDRTINDLYEFFKKNALEEIGSDLAWCMRIGYIEEGIKRAGVNASWNIGSEPIADGRYTEYLDIECPKCRRITRFKQPLRSGSYLCINCKLILIELKTIE
jgi:hypothetical protein